MAMMAEKGTSKERDHIGFFLEFKVRIWAFFAHAAPICLFYAFRHLNKPFYIQKSKGIKCARRNGASWKLGFGQFGSGGLCECKRVLSIVLRAGCCVIRYPQLGPKWFIAKFQAPSTNPRYLGSIIHCSLISDADVDNRISKASAALGALRNLPRLNTSLITPQEMFKRFLFCLHSFMGVRFGAYEKTYSQSTPKLS